MNRINQYFTVGYFVLCLSCMVSFESNACSRVLHSFNNAEFVVTGRNMDWFEDIKSNLWLFPRGMLRNGSTKENPVKWVSKYGSVVASGFDVVTTDGLNEKGLMVNLLYLGEADFGVRDTSRPGLSWSIYSQYLLDNFATVDEAVQAMKIDYFQVVTSPSPGSTEKPPSLHFSLSDETGDSAIFEYIKGKLTIHHGKAYQVMTNSPPYDQQLALNEYWRSVGGQCMLPGTSRASDRFVRASYYNKILPNPGNDREAIAYIVSIMCNVAVPFGTKDPEKPNIAPTIWRTIADNKNKIYFFKSSLSESMVWVDFSELNFKAGSLTRKISLVNNYQLSGNISAHFKTAKPFTFAGNYYLGLH